MNYMNYENIALISLVINFALGVCLLSPNIVYVIHRRWFKWRDDESKWIVKAMEFIESSYLYIETERSAYKRLAIFIDTCHNEGKTFDETYYNEFVKFINDRK